MNKRTLIDVIGLLLIGIVVVVGYKLSPLLLPSADVSALPEAGCDLQQRACVADLPGGGRLELTLSPRPVPLLSPFRVEARVRSVAVARVEIDFAGAEMNMGYNRLPLVAQGNGVFAAEATLPVCVSGRMDWLATVIVDTGRQRVSVPYRFTSGT